MGDATDKPILIFNFLPVKTGRPEKESKILISSSGFCPKWAVSGIIPGTALSYNISTYSQAMVKNKKVS